MKRFTSVAAIALITAAVLVIAPARAVAGTSGGFHYWPNSWLSWLFGGLGSGGATPSQIFGPDGVEGESQIFG